MTKTVHVHITKDAYQLLETFDALMQLKRSNGRYLYRSRNDMYVEIWAEFAPVVLERESKKTK